VKLLMYVLLLLNLALALGQWLEYRKVKVLPEFSKVAGVDHIELLAGGSTDVARQECWLLGPMPSESQAVAVRNDVARVDYFAELVSSDIQKAPGYWVYFGPLASYDDSLVQLKEFKSKGIDSFIIGEPRLKGSISLGVFNNIDSARRMTAIMMRKGYQVKVAEIPKYDKEYWVSLRVPEKPELKGEFEVFLEQEKKQFDARKVFCK